MKLSDVYEIRVDVTYQSLESDTTFKVEYYFHPFRDLFRLNNVAAILHLLKDNEIELFGELPCFDTSWVVSGMSIHKDLNIQDVCKVTDFKAFDISKTGDVEEHPNYLNVYFK